MIISVDLNVSPREVEDVFADHARAIGGRRDRRPRREMGRGREGSLGGPPLSTDGLSAPQARLCGTSGSSVRVRHPTSDHIKVQPVRYTAARLHAALRCYARDCLRVDSRASHSTSRPQQPGGRPLSVRARGVHFQLALGGPFSAGTDRPAGALRGHVAGNVRW
jgi:hypothetical protein